MPEKVKLCILETGQGATCPLSSHGKSAARRNKAEAASRVAGGCTADERAERRGGEERRCELLLVVTMRAAFRLLNLRTNVLVS